MIDRMISNKLMIYVGNDKQLINNLIRLKVCYLTILLMLKIDHGMYRVLLYRIW